MSTGAIKSIKPLGFPWETSGPFLFCVHHLDRYPAGNEEMGPAASLAGRNLGYDFAVKDGWRMYHGSRVPGFPEHPHRGFETVTVVLQGFADHADSMGAAGRYGEGDVQWMTAGAGIQHSEMFPLLNREGPNTLELLQIWLNLPRASKFVDPHYTMLWREDIPIVELPDRQGNTTRIKVVAGTVPGKDAPPPPPPDSWAHDPHNGVAIWVVEMEASATWELAAADPDLSRTLYFFQGEGIRIDDDHVEPYHGVELRPGVETAIVGGATKSRLLILQGRPIPEPVVQQGPFVMNTEEEIYQAYADFRATRFGGWPWPSSDPVHARDKGRFARHSDGREELKE